MFNGLLCAVGVEEGCDGVRDAQGLVNGKQFFYRSPRQRWNAENDCLKGEAAFNGKQPFCTECTSTFSPDMGLGVMLYILKTGRYDAFHRWIDAIEAVGKTTKLCKADVCTPFAWPRLCEADYKCGTKKPTDIAGLTSGFCILVPLKDSPDYGLLARHTKKPLGPLMTAAVTAPAILDQISPIPAAARDEALALKLRTNYPLHLEALRVFLRIMQRNPDLSIERFPPGSLPTLNIDSIDLRSSENPWALHVRAQTIYSRQKWNPFYRLLAEGPTKATRKQILSLCPTTNVQPGNPAERAAWIWRWETDKVNERPYTMGGGWDCVFVGMLYNKMRVEEDYRKRILQLFDELSDPTGRLLNQVNADLSKAIALAERLEKEASRLSKIVDDSKDRALKETYKLRDEAQSNLEGIKKHAEEKQKEINKLNEYIERKMPKCGGGDGCKYAKKKARKALKNTFATLGKLAGEASSFADQLTKVNAAITAYNQTIDNWSDQTLQGAQKSALEAFAKARSTANELQAKAERVQANREKARGYVKVWKS